MACILSFIQYKKSSQLSHTRPSRSAMSAETKPSVFKKASRLCVWFLWKTYQEGTSLTSINSNSLVGLQTANTHSPIIHSFWAQCRWGRWVHTWPLDCGTYAMQICKSSQKGLYKTSDPFFFLNEFTAKVNTVLNWGLFFSFLALKCFCLVVCLFFAEIPGQRSLHS